MRPDDHDQAADNGAHEPQVRAPVGVAMVLGHEGRRMIAARTES